MQRDRNLIHHQIKRHPLRRLHTHKHRSEQQRTHPLRSSQLQPRHLDIRPPLRLGKLPPIHRRQTQNATNIALPNTPLPHEYIPGIRKISRPVTHNPTTNRIIRRPSPHLTQTHRILSTARTLTPGSSGQDPQNDHHPSPPNQQRQPPQHHATQPTKPDFQPRNPVHAASSVLPQPLWLLPRFEPAQPTHPTPPRDPRPLNLLLCPGRSTPRLPPSVFLNSAILCMQPFSSFLSRRGSSFVLSPHNPPTQLPRGTPGR